MKQFYMKKNVNDKVTGMKWMPGKEKLLKHISNDAISLQMVLYINDIRVTLRIL